MNGTSNIFALTSDADLGRRLKAYSEQIGHLGVQESANQLSSKLKRRQASVTVVDTRHPEAFQFLRDVSEQGTATSIIALVEPKSDMERQLGEFSVFATFDFRLERLAYQRTLLSARDYSRMRIGSVSQMTLTTPNSSQTKTESPDFSAVLRLMRSLAISQDVYDELVATLADLLQVNRVTLVIKNDADYRVVAGTKLTQALRKEHWNDDDKLPLFLTEEARPFDISSLEGMDSDESELISNNLNNFRSSMLVPLFLEGHLIGWYFIGKPILRSMPDSICTPQALRTCEATLGILEGIRQSEQLKLKHRLLDSVISCIPIGLLVLDGNSEVRWINEQAAIILQGSYETLIGKPATELPASVSEAIEKLLVDDASHCESCTILERIYRVERHFGATDNESIDSAQVFSLTDITDSELLEAEHLKRSRAELLCDMNENLAFSLRSPLTAIRAFAQLLPEQHFDEAFAEKFNKIVCAEVDRLTELSHNLGAVSRLAMRTEQKNQPFALSEAFEVTQQLLGEAWQRCEVSGDVTKFELDGDHDRLGEGLCYLIQNAIEASQGVVSIFVTGSHSEFVELRVTDRRETTTHGSFVDNSSLQGEIAVEKADTRLRIAARILSEFGSDLRTETKPEGVCIYCQLPLAR